MDPEEKVSGEAVAAEEASSSNDDEEEEEEEEEEAKPHWRRWDQEDEDGWAPLRTL
ncbi:hypothetical protein FOMPIDRAFT_1051750 [Fomitopsis schrenkii]|uniref:Uncharacterized protein n=1 Tax=Fomitopsis schrenkii TaxID=2126942 RepID=S8F942_FOMSC|nr:hypothetical protein FOMPIDRAFT_1051750 [Fomitopsis schrenkii]